MKYKNFKTLKLYSQSLVPEHLHNFVRPKHTLRKDQTRTNYQLYVKREKSNNGKYEQKISTLESLAYFLMKFANNLHIVY